MSSARRHPAVMATRGALTLAALTFLLPTAAAAEAVGDADAKRPDPVARVISVRGPALLANPEAAAKVSLVRGAKLYASDQIETGVDAAVRLLLTDRSIIDIGASTTLNIGEVAVTRGRRQVSLRLTVGRIWSRVSSFFSGETQFEIETRTAVAGVRGTEFVVEADGDGATKVSVVSGAVNLRTTSGLLQEVIQATFTGAFSGTGEIIIQPLDPAALAALAAEMKPKPRLSKEQREQLGEQGGADTPTTAPPPPAILDPLDSPAPPLEAEPGSGRATVKGTLEVRE